MDNWIVDRSHLHCGILRTSLAALKAGLPVLAKELRRKLSANQTLHFYRQKQDETQVLLYHAPFRDAGLLYGLWTKASREVPGNSIEWKDWLPQWSKFPKSGRSLNANWEQFASGRFTISVVTPSAELNEYARLNFHRAYWASDSSPEFRSLAKGAVRAFAAAIGLSDEQMESPSKTDQFLVHAPDKVGASPSISLLNLDMERCFQLFEKSLSAVEKVLGVADFIDFGIDLAISNVEEGFESLKNVPQVWSHYRTDWTPHTTDIYALPTDNDFVRAYPVLTLYCKNAPKLCFQINIVHAQGQSFIECQAYEDRKWFDVLSQFFEAPIDYWEGPLESRFGWYGNVTEGQILRHETSQEQLIANQVEVTKSLPKEVKAFLLLPLGIDYGGPNNFFVVDHHERYEDAAGIFKSRREAIKFAKGHAEAIMGTRDLDDIILALAGENFGFDELPEEIRKRLRDLLGINGSIDPKLGKKSVQKFMALRDSGAIALEVLGENAYRILEGQIEESEFQVLKKRIKAGQFDMKLRNKIAELFGLEFADWQFELYAD